jgi:hypothetical protein
MFQINVVIDIDARPFPFREHIGLRRQRSQHGQIDAAIQFLAGTGELTKRALVELAGQFADGLVSSAKLKNCRLRSAANTQRWTTCTPASTLALP